MKILTVFYLDTDILMCHNATYKKLRQILSEFTSIARTTSNEYVYTGIPVFSSCTRHMTLSADSYAKKRPLYYHSYVQ